MMLLKEKMKCLSCSHPAEESKQNEINAAIEADENNESVDKHVETFNTVLSDFMELQVSVQTKFVE